MNNNYVNLDTSGFDDVIDDYVDNVDNADDLVDEQSVNDNDDNHDGEDYNQNDDDDEHHADDNDDNNDDDNDDEDGVEDQDDDVNNGNENNYIYNVLTSRGINPNEIHFEDEDGNDVSYSFDELSDEEKENILNYNPSDIELSASEQGFIDSLRKNNVSIDEYIEYIKNEALKSVENTEITYEVDDLSDDDVFLNMMSQQYPDHTDEELFEELELAKQNEASFKKKVDHIRTQYKAQEDQYNNQKAEQEQANEAEKEKEIKHAISNAAINKNDFMSIIELDDEDRSDVLKYIFDKDINGKSSFYKDLENPEKLFELALFASKMTDVENSFVGEINSLAAENKKLSTELARLKSKTNNKTTETQKKSVVQKKSQKKYTPNMVVYAAGDLSDLC